MWNSFRPASYFKESTDDKGEEGWEDQVRALFLTVNSLEHSLNAMLDRIPLELKKIKEKLEETSVFVKKAFSTAEDLRLKLSTLPEDVFGSRLSRESFLTSYASVTAAIEDLANGLTNCRQDTDDCGIDIANIELLMDDLSESIRSVAQKVAEALLAATKQSIDAEQKLSARIDNLPLNSGNMKSAGSNSTPHTRPTASLNPSCMFDAVMQGASDAAPQVGIVGASTGQCFSGDEVLGYVDGVPVSPQSLMQSFASSAATIEDHWKELNALKSSTYAKGVKVDAFSFEDIAEVVKLVDETPALNKDDFAICVDAVSIFAHYMDGNDKSEKSTAELKAVKAADISDPSSGRYVASFRQKHPTYLLNASGTPVPENSQFPMLETRTAWEGQAGLTGERAQLVRALQDAATTTITYINDHVKPGTLRDLATHLVHQSQTWWTSLIQHICTELLTLGQYGIPERKVYTLANIGL